MTWRAASLGLSIAALAAALLPPAWAHAASCLGPRRYRDVAELNGLASGDMSWAPFGRPEQGWGVYAPRIGLEIRSRCAPDSLGFAAAVARWQRHEGLPATGQLEPATFEAMKAKWQAQRPFIALRQAGVCPAPPAPSRLLLAQYDETLGGKIILLRVRALQAWRRMVAQARGDDPAIAADPQAMALFSGYRSPADDDARCLKEDNCDGVVRAGCSAHRTGLAMDLNVGWAPGFLADSSAEENRLAQVNGPAYRWMLAHARRYGFVNYPYEPWHWEWTGEAP